MDWKLFAMTFGAIFFAELADKTQLVSMSMTAKHGRPFLIWSASVCAYMLVTAFSVFLGSIITKYVRPEIIRYTAAGLFIILGVLIVLKKI